MNRKKRTTDLKELIAHLFPENKKQRIVLFAFELLFLGLALFLALKTWVIDHQTINLDIYLDLDTQFYVKELFTIRGHTYFRVAHPLINILVSPVAALAEVAGILLGIKGKTVVLVLATSFSVSFSVLLVYKYLKNVTEISNKRALLLTTIFALFSNSLIISFSPESYSFSMLLLSFAIYYYSINIKKHKNIPVKNIFILTIISGGVTITNALKTLTPVLFLNQSSLKKRIIKLAIYGGTLIVLLVLYFVVLRLFVGDGADQLYFFDKYKRMFIAFRSNSRLDSFYHLPYWQAVVVYFWGAPMLFTPFSNYPLYPRFKSPQLNVIPYDSIWLYLIIGVLFLLVIIAFIKNAKKSPVLLLLSMFSVDIFIHLITRWGLMNAYIFGGHWTFIVPMLLGWLYFSTKKDAHKTVIDVLLYLILLAVIVNNSIGIYRFIDFALLNYGT